MMNEFLSAPETPKRSKSMCLHPTTKCLRIKKIIKLIN